MGNMDLDLQSIQEARDLARLGEVATKKLAECYTGQYGKNCQGTCGMLGKNGSRRDRIR